MRLYYTASMHEANQSKLSLSIGGYKSSVPVPNDVFGNMFSDITMYTVKMGVLETCLALVLKNEYSSEASPLVWFNVPEGCYSKFQISVVDMATDSDGNPVMERLIHNGAKPVYAEFADATPESKFSVGAMEPGKVVGLWIKRELDLDVIKQDQGNIAEKDPNDPYRYVELELSKSDTIEFHIEF